MSLLAKLKKTHIRITISITECSIFIYYKTWRHESESVKIIYLDTKESLICSRILKTTQISAVNMDAESGYLMEITVIDGNTVAHATQLQSRQPSVLGYGDGCMGVGAWSCTSIKTTSLINTVVAIVPCLIINKQTL